MIALSKIYALYGVFDGQPINSDEIASIKKNSLAKSCTKLINRVAYKPLQIQEKACSLCRYSPNFKNARLKDELIILRRLIEPTMPFIHCILLPNESFISLYRMSADYAIGDYPIIPLNYYLYNFLSMNDKDRFTKIDLINHFTHYLMMNDTAVANYYDNMDDLLALITTYINDIYRIPLSHVSEEAFQKSRAVFLDSYTYDPSIYEPTSMKKVDDNITTPDSSIHEVIKQPIDLADLSTNIETKNKLDEELYAFNTLDLKTNSPIPSSQSVMQPIVTDGTELDTKSVRNEYQCSHEKLDDSPKETTDNNDNDFINMINAKVSETTINQIAAVEIVDTRTEKNKSLYCKNCIEEKEEKDITCCVKEKVLYDKCKTHECFYAPDRYIINQDFLSNITIFDTESSTSFMSDMIHSYFIGLEVATVNNKKGILIYCSYNWKHYFYDIELVGIEPLNFHFTDTGKTFISFHTYEVIGYINKFGICNPMIHDLQLMYCIINDAKNIPLFQILNETTFRFNKIGQDFYHFAMRFYKDIFEKLYSQLQLNDSFLLSYNRTLRLYNVLSKTYDLSDICETDIPGIKLKYYNNFEFAFNWSQRFIKEGIAYRIILPDNCLSTHIDSDSIIMDICLLLKNMPRSHRIRSRILSISKDELTVFYEGSEAESRRFYDILINGIRIAYSRRYSDILTTQTYSILISSKPIN